MVEESRFSSMPGGFVRHERSLLTASIVAPFEYASMLVAAGIGFVVFDEVPTPMMLTGAAIVILAGLLIILREHQLNIRRGIGRRHVTKYG